MPLLLFGGKYTLAAGLSPNRDLQINIYDIFSNHHYSGAGL